MMEENMMKNYITYDSIISLCMVTEKQSLMKEFYIMRSEFLEGKILIRNCNPYSDITLIKESLFIVRRLKENSLNGITLENEQERNKSEIVYNKEFTLQHLISKKFLAKEKVKEIYSLQLVEKEESALPFSFKRIVDNKNFNTFVQFSQNLYLSASIKENSQTYFVNTQLPFQNEEVYSIMLTLNYNYKFQIVNQEHFNEYFKTKIYSGDLLNIVFSIKDKDSRNMLAVVPPENKKVNQIRLKDVLKEEILSLMLGNVEETNIGNTSKLKIRSVPKTDHRFLNEDEKAEYFTQVNLGCFWVIEQHRFWENTKAKSPIKSGEKVRIKNAILNLYLAVEKNEKGEYNFFLLDENLINIHGFSSNFYIDYYSVNEEKENLISHGKYIIRFCPYVRDKKSVNEKWDYEIQNHPQELKLDEVNGELKVLVGECIFELRKIDLVDGNESIYIKNILNNLNSYIENSQENKTDQNSNIVEKLKKNFIFLSNYLLNLDYSFNDKKLDKYFPVTQRQNLLKSYDIIKIINDIVNFFMPTRDDVKPPEHLVGLIKQIYIFLIFLSYNNDDIKSIIYEKWHKLIKIGDLIFPTDKTILLYFIFEIMANNSLLHSVLFTNNKINIISYLEKSTVYFDYFHKITTFKKKSHRKNELDQLILNNTKVDNSCYLENLKKNCDEVIIIFDEVFPYLNNLKNNQEYYENVMKFLDVMKSFDLFTFLYLKECFVSSLAKLSQAHNKKIKSKQSVKKDPSTPFSAMRKKSVYPSLSKSLPAFGVIRKKSQIGKNLIEINEANEDPDETVNLREDKPQVLLYPDKNSELNEMIEPRKSIEDDLVKSFELNYVPVDRGVKHPEEKEESEKEEIPNEKKNIALVIKEGKENMPKLDFYDTELYYMINNEINESNFYSEDDLKLDTSFVQSLPSIGMNDFFPRYANEKYKFSLPLPRSNSNKFNITAPCEKLKKSFRNLLCYYQFGALRFFEEIYYFYKQLKSFYINFLNNDDIDVTKISVISTSNEMTQNIFYLYCEDEILSIPIIKIYNSIYLKSQEKEGFEPSLIELNDLIKYEDETNEKEEEFYNYKYLLEFYIVHDKIFFLLDKIRIYIMLKNLANNTIDEQKFFTELSNILNKKDKLIKLIHSVKEEKDKYCTSINNISIYKIRSYILERKFEFFTKMLCKYDLTNYFDKIINVKTPQQLESLKISSMELKALKENLLIVNGQQHDDDLSMHQNCIEKMVNSLDTIKNKSLDAQKKEKIDEKIKQNPFEYALLSEKPNYYKKTGFPKLLIKLITVLEKFSIYKDPPLETLKTYINYCSSLLDGFKGLCETYEDFEKIMQSEYKQFIKLIDISLETVIKYIDHGEKASSHIYLSIIYEAVESFRKLVESTFIKLVESKHLEFIDIKKIMETTMKKLDIIYINLQEENLKAEFMIFYIFLVSRILKVLNRNKIFDFYNYEKFFKEIFNNETTRKNICRSLGYFVEKANVISEDYNDYNDYLETNQNVLILNFLTIYTIYLNELNLIKQTERTGGGIASGGFKLETMKNKIKNFLCLEGHIENYEEEEIHNKTSVTKQSRKESLINNHGDFETLITENGEDQNNENDFDFELILLRSVIGYKYDKSEIQVSIKVNSQYKKICFLYYKGDMIDLLLLEKLLKQMSISKKFLQVFKPNEHLNYEKDKIMQMNTEYKNNMGPKSLREILAQKQNFLSIISRAKGEKIFYKILYDEFTTSNMYPLLDKLVKEGFDTSDFKEIDVMNFFDYSKATSMYDTKLFENLGLIKSEKGNSEIVNRISKGYTHSESSDDKIRIKELLYTIKYMFQKFDQTTLLNIFNYLLDTLEQRMKEFYNKSEISREFNMKLIMKNLIALFEIEENKKLIKKSTIFFKALNAIRFILTIFRQDKKISISESSDLLNNFFNYSEFIFDNLAEKIESIVKFFNNSDSCKKFKNFDSKVKRLENMIEFITIIIEFTNRKDYQIESNKLKKFNSEILEKIMRLIIILLEWNDHQSNKTIIILINFLNQFIYGPNIDNLKLLFKLANNGFYKLLKIVINKLDYYEVIRLNINYDDLDGKISTLIEIEYKIMQIFFIFFNLVNNGKGDKYIYVELKRFFDEQQENIKNKLKKIFYIFSVEKTNHKFFIEDSLLYYENRPFYTDEELLIKVGITRVGDQEKERYSFSTQADNFNTTKYNIKFELLLVYYNLYILHREVLMENYISITSSSANFGSDIKDFIYSLFDLIYSFIFLIPKIISIIVKRYSKKVPKKTRHRLFNKLYEINENYLKTDESEMLQFLKKHITSVEVYIDDIIYKVYFPILSKSHVLKEAKTKIISVNTSELENYIYHIMNEYDEINTQASQNFQVDRAFDLPIVKSLFVNMKLFKSMSLIIAFLTNFLILASYSNFTKTNCNYGGKISRLDCPSLFYQDDPEIMRITHDLFRTLGLCQLIFNCLIFVNFYIRCFAVEHSKTLNRKKIDNAKKQQTSSVIGHFKKLVEIFIPSFFRSLFTAESIFYMCQLTFSYLGIFYHNFFYGFMLVEVILRVSVLKGVVLAIYTPRVQIFVTLILFLILVYYFTLFAISYFDQQFPNQNDTKNIIDCFMRMLDQTFKQDGGVGAYLNITLDDNYIANNSMSFQGVRFFYDNLFNYLILILVFQMFLSIIKDFFSRQREDQKIFEETTRKICLICGIEREKIEKIYYNKNAFDIHSVQDHNIYDYICYLNYLQNKICRDFTIEKKVWDKHLNNDYRFLPKNICFKEREKNMIKEISKNK